MNGKSSITTYGQLYSRAMELLNSRFECGQLLYHVTCKKTYHLPHCKDKPVPQEQVDMLLSMCEKRLQGVPLQYLLGEWSFYGLPFKVGKGVLIPRSDTETLVDVALSLIKDLPKPCVLDLCSGSGCIAISIAHNLPNARVRALEISSHALVYLRQNVQLNSSSVEIVHGDLQNYQNPDLLDLLISNPPYIPEHVLATLQKEVTFEPRRALNGGTDGLYFYRSISQLYRPQLLIGGWVCFEVGIGQSEQVAEILLDNGYDNIHTTKDLNGIQRVVYAQRTQD